MSVKQMCLQIIKASQARGRFQAGREGDGSFACKLRAGKGTVLLPASYAQARGRFFCLQATWALRKERQRNRPPACYSGEFSLLWGSR